VHPRAGEWISQLDLQPHLEGGYFRETYRSVEIIKPGHLPDRFSGPRSISTAIFFLLEGNQVSKLHRLRADEVWHFYEGSAVTIHQFHPDGQYRTVRLGCQPERNTHPQTVVPARIWFGVTVDDPGTFALLGCTVAPGFDFQDFEMANRLELLKQFPKQKLLIEQLS